MKTLDPRLVDLVSFFAECSESVERPGIVAVFQLWRLDLNHPDMPRMEMEFTLNVVKFPHDRFFSALHS